MVQISFYDTQLQKQRDEVIQYYSALNVLFLSGSLSVECLMDMQVKPCDVFDS